jgi:hypothetical protein
MEGGKKEQIESLSPPKSCFSLRNLLFESNNRFEQLLILQENLFNINRFCRSNPYREYVIKLWQKNRLSIGVS